MSWIKGEEFDFNSFLLTERFQIRQMFGDIGNNAAEDTEYLKNMGIALNYNPIVRWYFLKKCPERAEFIEKVVLEFAGEASPEEVRKAEVFVMEGSCDFITYANPEIMATTGGWWTMNEWDKARLFELADFTDKIVLDVGSGSGRLAFAAAEKAAWVYASEPVDTLREFMRDKIKREGIKNMRVVDGYVKELPYPDSTFDIVTSAHVVGDEYDLEIAELERVCKSGGWLLDSPGHGEPSEPEPLRDEQQDGSNSNEEELISVDNLVKRGWESMRYDRYRKQVWKEAAAGGNI